MKQTVFTRHPVIYNDRTKRIEPVITEIFIDLDKLAELLSRKAMKSKKGRASVLFGAVRVKVHP